MGLIRPPFCAPPCMTLHLAYLDSQNGKSEIHKAGKEDYLGLSQADQLLSRINGLILKRKYSECYFQLICGAVLLFLQKLK